MFPASQSSPHEDILMRNVNVFARLPMRPSAGRWWQAIRSYSANAAATPVVTPPTPRSRLGKKAMSLDHFIQRSKALGFYRAILRGTARIGDPSTKEESRRYARAEFERHRSVTDIAHIRYLLSTGKVEWDGMQRYIDGM
ncbi:hypothetical protein F5X68DRAFT_265779 [Plectosphaerella plurivora]|uniref:LYR motif-containing protein 2 n=1 Tax=Plectosphaerella plurivora TaxID=936078 RepID=A0A9P8V1P9_9PEZI|nr:hypothetical protein F5X68DRAFT_265779 [Plectosphaerella plurivora]